jgi:hypothetical protein
MRSLRQWRRLSLTKWACFFASIIGFGLGIRVPVAPMLTYALLGFSVAFFLGVIVVAKIERREPDPWEDS